VDGSGLILAIPMAALNAIGQINIFNQMANQAGLGLVIMISACSGQAGCPPGQL
jgi:hypothetical protein